METDTNATLAANTTTDGANATAAGATDAAAPTTVSDTVQVGRRKGPRSHTAAHRCHTIVVVLVDLWKQDRYVCVCVVGRSALSMVCDRVAAEGRKRSWGSTLSFVGVVHVCALH